MLTMRWWAKVQLACGKIYSWWIKVTWPHPQPLSITPFRFIYHISVFSNLAILNSIQVGRFYGNSFARLFVCLLVAVVVSIAKPGHLQQEQYGLLLYVNLEILERIFDGLPWSLLFPIPVDYALLAFVQSTCQLLQCRVYSVHIFDKVVHRLLVIF